MLYKNLVGIGLSSYLDTYFFNDTWTVEPYLEKLDQFVSQKNNKQKEILHRKFHSLNNHTIINDHLYEIMIGAVFHPAGDFQDNDSTENSPDIIENNIKIEVKNINAEPAEIERVKRIIPDTMSYGPFPDDSNFEQRIREKFSQRVDKAKLQISGKGIIYIIWDTSLKGSTERKPKIKNLFATLISNEKEKFPDIEIVAIDFQDLRNLVAKT